MPKQECILNLPGYSFKKVSEENPVYIEVNYRCVVHCIHGYELRYKKIAIRSCSRVLGLDEHSFNRKVGYATTFCDLAKHKIFDEVTGCSEKDLKSYLNHQCGLLAALRTN